MDDPSTIADLITVAATGVRRLTTDEFRRVIEHVAAAGFDPNAREKARGRLAGITWQGRVLKDTDLVSPAEVHYLRHVVDGQEWPLGTTLQGYLDSIFGIILDPTSGILTSRYQGALQLSVLRRTGRLIGPRGFAWILVDYRVVTGHWMTAYQPKEEFDALRDPKREDIRWLRQPRSPKG